MRERSTSGNHCYAVLLQLAPEFYTFWSTWPDKTGVGFEKREDPKTILEKPPESGKGKFE